MEHQLGLAYIPLAKINEERLTELREIVRQLPEDQLWSEFYSDEDSFSEKERQKLLDAVDFLPTAEDHWRDVWHLDHPDLTYELLFSGGLCWGDDPTEAYTHFMRLMECEPVWERLVEWAKADG